MTVLGEPQPLDPEWFGKYIATYVGHSQAEILERDFRRALAAERRATVERIRERLSERGFAGQPWVLSVLDEEAAR